METGVPFFLTESSYNAIIKHDWRTSMIVLGYKAGTNFTDVAGALKKHTNMDAKTVKKLYWIFKKEKVLRYQMILCCAKTL